jgi:NAD+ kinase
MTNHNRDVDHLNAKRLTAHLTSLGVELFCMEEDAGVLNLPCFSPHEHHVDFAVILGGDGTLLHAARYFAPLSIPLLGINMGRLGFMSEIQPEDAPDALNLVLNGEYRVEHRAMLKGTVFCKGEATGEPLFALNEIGLFRSFEGGVTHILVDCNGVFADGYACDGVMVSTPTGSTGYALSAGAPIVQPTVDCLLIVPVCAHSLYARPMVVEGGAKVGMRTQNARDCCKVMADDSVVRFPPGLDAELVIERAPFDAKFIRLNDTNYFKQLRKKLIEWNTPDRKDERE